MMCSLAFSLNILPTKLVLIPSLQRRVSPMFCQAEQAQRGKSPPIPTLATKGQGATETEEDKGDKTKVTHARDTCYSRVVSLALIAVFAHFMGLGSLKPFLYLFLPCQALHKFLNFFFFDSVNIHEQFKSWFSLIARLITFQPTAIL